MKFYRIQAFLLGSVGLIYLAVWLFYNFSYGISQSDPLIVNKVREFSARVADKLSYYDVDELFYLKDIETDKSTNIFFEFSDSDRLYNDSIISFLKDNKVRVFEDVWKKWRKVDIIHKDKKIRAKYKFHGSSTSQYINGYRSYSVRAKQPINGKTSFKLVTCFEFSYINIFTNYIGSRNGLIVEDVGKVVAVGSNDGVFDYVQYRIFDENYLSEKYELNDPIILRRNTFESKGNPAEFHSSPLDDCHYNLDLKEVPRDVLTSWKNFLTTPTTGSFDPSYVGKYLAFLQYWGHPHSITGNNDKWIFSNGKFYPVLRYEGNPSVLTFEDLNGDPFFAKFYHSSSHDVYKNLLINEEVLYHRNMTLKSILDNQNKILRDLDSIYVSNSPVHQKYNDHFLKLKMYKDRNLATLEANSENIARYLDQGFTMVYSDGVSLRIKSSRVNLLEVKVSGRIFKFQPYIYNYDSSGKLSSELIEFTIDSVHDIKDLEIYDVILNKELKNEEDYHILIGS
jgi:hypothetical protein